MNNPITPWLLKSTIAAGALLGLGGCMYGSAGYYGDGYVNDAGYGCDPYAPFDDYYACDYGYGFANIGYGGGWYDQYYYPGYGIYIFDRGGRRHAMRDSHRRYWARQRATYGSHHTRDRNRYPQRRAERREQRYEQGNAVRDQRRGRNRDDADRRSNRGDRPVTRTPRRDRDGQAAPVRDRGDRSGRVDRGPSRTAGQARPQPSTRPAATPPRPEGPRQSRRTSRSARERLSDD